MQFKINIKFVMRSNAKVTEAKKSFIFQFAQRLLKNITPLVRDVLFIRFGFFFQF